MRIALAQLNPLVGDLSGNAKNILTVCRKAAEQGADLLITPELSLWGYPPRDLLLQSVLLKKQEETLHLLADTLFKEVPQISLLVGIAEPISDNQIPQLFNSVAFLEKRQWKIVARKQLLPTYDVFDEKRYFRSSKTPSVLKIKVNEKVWNLGITICEDLWVDSSLQKNRIAGPDPIAKLVPEKIDILINISASPFSRSKEALRKQLASHAGKRLSCPVIYVNQVGGNDELVFDGGSFVLDTHSQEVLKLPSCSEGLAIWDATLQDVSTPIRSSTSTPQEKLFQALVLGVSDYAKKCGFKEVLLGLSGGIDSALVAVVATAALGPENVTAALLPSQWSSIGSVRDALDLAKRLKINTHTIPITNLIEIYESTLNRPLGKNPEGITAENLQSRIRGTILMALANQQGQLLLSTGNKSELAVGYCTLYGDMNGGLSVIGDLYKTTVFDLCNWLDSESAYKLRQSVRLLSDGELIGEKIRKKAPSAELRPGQLDSDSLPDYSILDEILKPLIEEHVNPDDLIKRGHDAQLVTHIKQLIKKAEFKRRQAPPLLKVSEQAFGSGWRAPIATS